MPTGFGPTLNNSMESSIEDILLTYLKAGYPALALITPEHQRMERCVIDVVGGITPKRTLFSWTMYHGLLNVTDPEGIAETNDPLDLLKELKSMLDSDEELPKFVVLIHDFQLYFENTDPMLISLLKELLIQMKLRGCSIIMLGCRCKMPPELEHEVTLIDVALPNADTLGQVLDSVSESAFNKPVDPGPERDDLLAAASGLTTIEAESVFALSYVKHKAFVPKVVAREKAGTLKRNGLLEIVETGLDLNSIGGYEELKKWLVQRKVAFSKEAAAYGLPAPKGLLITGIPGTGKSLTAKAAAGVFGLPLLKLDMGRVFAGLVGESEANVRSVIQTAEAMAPCVLYIDEVEKGMSGSKSSGSTDGGTASRVFGSFINWMQEKTARVFIVATANSISAMPPEFLRRGRFDCIFHVDLPSQAERVEILDVVIRKYGRDPANYTKSVMAKHCDQFTGAEIEAVFVDAMYTAFTKNREVTDADIAEAAAGTIPIAKTMAQEIKALREWADGRARNASARVAAPKQVKGSRGLN